MPRIADKSKPADAALQQVPRRLPANLGMIHHDMRHRKLGEHSGDADDRPAQREQGPGQRPRKDVREISVAAKRPRQSDGPTFWCDRGEYPAGSLDSKSLHAAQNVAVEVERMRHHEANAEDGFWHCGYLIVDQAHQPGARAREYAWRRRPTCRLAGKALLVPRGGLRPLSQNDKM